MIIIHRLKTKLEQELPEEQAAYRKGRVTRDMLVCLQILMKKILAIDEEVFIMFIDYSKTFDSVSHVKLFAVMMEMGFPAHLVCLLQALYVNQRGRIRWNGENTEEFNMTKCETRMHHITIFVCDLHRECNEGCWCGTFWHQSRRQTKLQLPVCR